MSEKCLSSVHTSDFFDCIWNSRLEIIFHQNFEGLAVSYLLVHSVVTEVSEPFWFLMIRMLSVLPTAKTCRIFFLSLVLWHLWWCALGWFFFISTGPCQSEDSCPSGWKVFTSFPPSAFPGLPGQSFIQTLGLLDWSPNFLTLSPSLCLFGTKRHLLGNFLFIISHPLYWLFKTYGSHVLFSQCPFFLFLFI